MTHPNGYLISWLLRDLAQAAELRAGAGQHETVCRNCHTPPTIDRVYRTAEQVVAATNNKVLGNKRIIEALHKDGVLSPSPFRNPIDFAYFDLWHYYGRTAKHGAFMGGADFVQWHGNYPLLKSAVEIESQAAELREARAKKN